AVGRLHHISTRRPGHLAYYRCPGLGAEEGERRHSGGVLKRVSWNCNADRLPAQASIPCAVETRAQGGPVGVVRHVPPRRRILELKIPWQFVSDGELAWQAGHNVDIELRLDVKA